MFFIMCIIIRKYSLPKIIGVILNSFILAMAYASFQLFVLLDPNLGDDETCILTMSLHELLSHFVSKGLANVGFFFYY